MQPHPPEIRARALELATAGETHGAIARQLGVTQQAVSRWCKAAGLVSTQAVRTRAAREVAVEATKLKWATYSLEAVDELAGLVQKTIREMNDALDNGKARNASDLTRVLCGTIDKAQLLSGGATGRPDVSGDRDRLVADGEQRALRLVADGTA